MQRDAAETNLTFLGLLVMENKLKAETKGVINNLNECHVRTIMATGDNVLTAISVARQCAILHENESVWLADVAVDKASGIEKVEWQNTKNIRANSMLEQEDIKYLEA
jgi:magnesium-transporting ATPase (P-type)